MGRGKYWAEIQLQQRCQPNPSALRLFLWPLDVPNRSIRVGSLPSHDGQRVELAWEGRRGAWGKRLSLVQAVPEELSTRRCQLSTIQYLVSWHPLRLLFAPLALNKLWEQLFWDSGRN